MAKPYILILDFYRENGGPRYWLLFAFYLFSLLCGIQWAHRFGHPNRVKDFLNLLFAE